MTKTERFRRRLENCYIKITVPELIQFLRDNGKDDGEIINLSDKISRLHYCLSYTTLKIVSVRYRDIISLAEELEECFDIPWTGFARILLSPFLPKAKFRDDDIKLIRQIIKYRDSFTLLTLKKDGKHLFSNTLAIKTSYESLIEQGVIVVSERKASLVTDFRSPFKVKEEEDLPEDGKWYLDDSLTLQYGKPPIRQGSLMAILESMRQAEEKYQKEWWAPIEKENTRLREIFEKDLEGLKKQSRDYYLSDIDYFLYTYFYYETINSIHEASNSITSFFYFFTHKCSRRSKYLVKRMVSVIKRFYTVMYNNEEVTKEEYERVLSEMKRNGDEYIDNRPHYIDMFD